MTRLRAVGQADTSRRRPPPAAGKATGLVITADDFGLDAAVNENDYRHTEALAALLSPRVGCVIAELDPAPGGFARRV